MSTGSMVSVGSPRHATFRGRFVPDWSTAEGAKRMRTLRALGATVLFVGFGAAAHRMGVGVPVQAIPKVIVAVLVAPLVWLLLPAAVSVPRALLAACGGQAVLHLALLGMEPSSGGSATRAHPHQDLPSGLADATGHAAGSPIGMSLTQAHVAAALLACVVLLVANDVLRAVLGAGAPAAATPGSAADPRAALASASHATARARRGPRSQTSITGFSAIGTPSPWGPSTTTKALHARMPPLAR
jgi:hypothetical protein